jgi:hypothetical protein
MAVKKLIQGQPKLNDLSQYNFENQDDNYKESLGLPKNNDKFQNKDLYTKAVGSELNNAIIERNLKVEGESFIKINRLFIGNDNVVGATANNRVRCYMLSQNYENLDNKSYSQIKNVLSREIFDADDNQISDVADRFFNDNPGDRGEGSDIGNVLNNQIIIQSLKSDSIEIEEFENNTPEYNANVMLPLRETDAGIIDNLNTSIIDENIYNPIYIVVYMEGNKRLDNMSDAQRKKRFTVFKINNLDLFNRGNDGIATGPKLTTFTKDDLSHYSRTGDGDGGSTDAAAWRVEEFSITISTRLGGVNNWDGTMDELSSDEKLYATYFPDVQPSINVIPVDLNKFGLLNLSQNMQLNNNGNPGENYTDLFPDYFPQTTIKVLNENNEMQDEDLQSYYDDNETLSIKASAPATIAVDLNPIDLVNEESIGINYFYFVIDWDDATDEIKTLDDWNEIRPTDEFELLELQNQNLYKLKTNVESVDDYTIQYQIIFPIEKIIPQPQTDSFIDNDGDYYTAVQHSNTGENRLPYVGFPIDISGTLDNNGQYNLANPPYTTSPPPNPQNVLLKGTLNAQEEPGGIATSLREQTFNSNVTFDNTIPMNTYTTPGIKTIKMVMFSYDGETNQVGRWKLITSRFYLDIPINQYPDFAEVGGSDYTTIPWPYTTPVIGGVDNNSKYKKSVQEALSSGNIGDADIIDEKFLINDLENDELGKSINEMDLEQCRYFDAPYDMNTLLLIPTSGVSGWDDYELAKETDLFVINQIEGTSTQYYGINSYNLEDIKGRWTEADYQLIFDGINEYTMYNGYGFGDGALSDSNTFMDRLLKNEVIFDGNVATPHILPYKTYGPSLDMEAYTSEEMVLEFFKNENFTPTLDELEPGNDTTVLFMKSRTNGTAGYYQGFGYFGQVAEVLMSTFQSGPEVYEEAAPMINNSTVEWIQLRNNSNQDIQFSHPNFPLLFYYYIDEELFEQNGEYRLDELQMGESIPCPVGKWVFIVVPDKLYTIDLINEIQFLNESISVQEFFQLPLPLEETIPHPYTEKDFWVANPELPGTFFPKESSVGQIFISDNQDLDLKQSCKLELNTGELTGKSIYDSSGNSNKGLLIGDYKVKKVRKGEPMRRDSFIKIPKKANNNNGAL